MTKDARWQPPATTQPCPLNSMRSLVRLATKEGGVT
jgi:hypothetical protein